MTSLKVTDVKRTVIRVPFRERSRPWSELLNGQWGIIEVVEVLTNDPEIIGIGETLLHYTWARVPEEATASVIGRPPAERMADDSLGAGLQMALYDAAAKGMDVPLRALLAMPQVREWAPISWWNTKSPPEVLAAEAEDALREGYVTHKFKARPWFDVFEQVEAVSAVTPAHYRIDLDWNGMLQTQGDAIEVLRQLDRYERVGMYESPIHFDDIEGMRLLREKIERPLAEHLLPWTFPHHIRQDAVDGFVVASRGVSGMLHYASMCAAFNKSFWLQAVGTGLTTALSAQLGAVMTHARWPAVTCLNMYDDDLIIEPHEIRGGYLHVPDGPGLGVELDREAVERYRIDAPHRAVYPRKLVSFSLPSGHVRHYAEISQPWDEARERWNMPPQQRGANLSVRVDDGTDEFDALYRRAAVSPVWE